MFDYTKMMIDQTVKDVKRIFHGYKVGSQLIYIAYLVYALIAQTGIWFANLALLVLSIAYFAFFMSTTDYGKTPDGKQLKNNVKTTYVWSKRLIRLFTISVAVYDIFTATTATNSISTLLTALMVIGWAIEVLFDLLIRIITARIALIKEALDADVDNLLKPVKTVGNFFKKAMGQEVQPSAEPSKRRLWLDKKMSERRELAKQEKERLAQEKRQKQEEERRKRQEQFALKKQQRLNRKNKTKDETNGAGTK